MVVLRPLGKKIKIKDGVIDVLAIIVAKEALEAGVGTFTYISAAGNFPGIPERYITSKRYIPPKRHKCFC
jgi:hypothetical protein